jgi:hypothetical protein
MVRSGGDSFLGSGDISRFSRSGVSGSIESQDAFASLLDSTGGEPVEFAISLSIDLNTGEACTRWTLPNGTAQTPTLQLWCLEGVVQASGQMLLFLAPRASDQAAYSLALLLS